MAYFDSAKNRVLWQRELSELRKERARREARGFAPGEQEPAAGKTDGRKRQRIDFRQLERDETEAAGRRESLRGRTRKLETEKQLQSEKEMRR